MARFKIVNHPDYGLLFDGATVLVESCYIEYHQGLDGGVSLRGGAQVGLSLSFVRHCTGDNLAGGGATVNEGCTLSLMNYSVVHNNWAPRGGGVRVYPNATLKVSGSAGIRNNAAATDGGGLVCHDPNPAAACVVRNCLIAHNRASGAWLDGGGLLENCTIVDNTPHGVIMTDGGTLRNSIACCNAGENVHSEGLGPSAEFSCVTPLLSLLGGEGCISNDPQFAGASDFHLLLGSPCLDAGTNLPWMAAATDLDGNPRSVDGLVDMGCYEFVPEPAIMQHFLLIAIGMVIRLKGVRLQVSRGVRGAICSLFVQIAHQFRRARRDGQFDREEALFVVQPARKCRC